MNKKTKNPVGKRREKQKAETYALILESAKYLFDSVGYEKTTMRAVATHAEIGLGTIYKHFPNKMSLLSIAFSDDLRKILDSSIKDIPEDGTIQKQFIHISRYYYTFYTSRAELSRAYLKNMLYYGDEWMNDVNALDMEYAKTVMQLVLSAQERGEISPEKDSEFVAYSFISNYFFVLATFFIRLKETDPEKMLTFLEKLLDQIVN